VISPAVTNRIEIAVTMNPLGRELAEEHRRDLYQKAADYRRSKAARATQRKARALRLTLRIRPIRASDAALLANLFARLSSASRLARYLYPKTHLSTNELRYFTEVDHYDHEALVAVTRVRAEPVGVARLVRNSDDPTTADVAVVVADEWQDRGVGTLLAYRLAARAVSIDVATFTALLAADNVRARRLLHKVGAPTVVERNAATVSYQVALPRGAPAATDCLGA
jgi:RimJ/RimL family protein N-acetyltransferase